MGRPTRGADLLLDALLRAGTRTIFTLSGNHVMSLFDAALDRDLTLIHTRHEGAAVHMAEGWARSSGQVGVALVTAGQGHASAVGALCTAQASETPLVLLSGHAPLRELGLGSFQEQRQADIAAPLTKASWTAASAETLSQDIARAWRIARAGRPGPVHISLPSDLLEAEIDAASVAALDPAAFLPECLALPADTARRIVAVLAEAKRPLVIAPPALATTDGAALLGELRDALGLPVVMMESPRGVADPVLGAFAELLADSDLIVLLAKPLDFTLRFGRPPAVAPSCRWIALDPDPALLDRAARGLGARLVVSAQADAVGAATALIAAARERNGLVGQVDWNAAAAAALAFRPAEWPRGLADDGAPLHPAALFGAVQSVLDRHPGSVFVSDGGEIGQWAQALLSAPHRLINGVAGAIGPSLPFAIGAKAARPDSTVLAVMGDGTFGFHMAELDTASRYGLPVVVVIGNDGRWNAEHQIQLRSYGADRAHGCTLRPGTRYDLVATALGGHGEWVTRGADLPDALDRAVASGKPAVVNVTVDGRAAPVIRRG
jgi:acetolactate synthase-1/2/3 large subunit